MLNLVTWLILPVWILFLATASNAQPILQCLYTAPQSGPPPGFLVQARDGNFYGTSAGVGTTSGNVFQLTSAGAFTLVGVMNGLNNGLAYGGDGFLYGTTAASGSLSLGSIFKINRFGLTTTVLNFNGTNGSKPSGIRAGMDGALYGTVGTNTGGFATGRHISVFQFTTNGTLTILYTVTSGADFSGLPVQAPDGFLYGTMAVETIALPPLSSSYRVSIYRLSTSGDFQNLFSISNAPGPAGDLIFGPDGLLYGAISASPKYPNAGYGSVFRISTDGAFTNLLTFNSSNGADPEARLLLANDNNIYGSTLRGGVGNHGTLFRITTNGDFATLLHFGGGNGAGPVAPLIEAGDGNLYGTTQGGLFPAAGTIFRLVQPTVVSNFSVSNGLAAITWNSFSNGIYRVEYNLNLLNSTWTPLVQRVTATDLTITIFDNLPTDPQRFYRVALLP
jgi:uncharacterized repeat protein (TIGR03803 family)